MKMGMKARAPAKPVFQPKEEISQCYFGEAYPDPFGPTDSYLVRAIYQKLEKCLPEEYRKRFEGTGEVQLIYEMPLLPANWVGDAEVPDELRQQKLIWQFSPDGVVGLRLVPCSLMPPEGFDGRNAECDD